MKLFNSIELTNYEESSVLNYIFLFTTFTLSLFFNVLIYFGFEDYNYYMLYIFSGVFFLHIIANIFLKNALRVLSKELFSLLLSLSFLFFTFFYFGFYLIGSLKYLILFFLIYVLLDFSIFYIRNGVGIYVMTKKCLESGRFNYAYREEYRINTPLKRSFLANIVLVVFCLILPVLLFFGKSLPYVFFGVLGGNADEMAMAIGFFSLASLMGFLSLNYIYLFILYLYFFLKVVYQNRNGINNI